MLGILASSRHEIVTNERRAASYKGGRYPCGMWMRKRVSVSAKLREEVYSGNARRKGYMRWERNEATEARPLKP